MVVEILTVLSGRREQVYWGKKNTFREHVAFYKKDLFFQK